MNMSSHLLGCIFRNYEMYLIAESMLDSPLGDNDHNPIKRLSASIPDFCFSDKPECC